MQTSTDLKKFVETDQSQEVYPAYKDTKRNVPVSGVCAFHRPCAGRSVCFSVESERTCEGATAGFPERVVLRRLPAYRFAGRSDKTGLGCLPESMRFRRKGSGKSGLISVSRCGQEGVGADCLSDRRKSGMWYCAWRLVFRQMVGRSMPGTGKILFDYVPECVENALFYKKRDAKKLRQVIDLAEDQAYIREQLKERGLVAFVANGSSSRNPACRQNRCAARSRLFLRKRWK